MLFNIKEATLASTKLQRWFRRASRDRKLIGGPELAVYIVGKIRKLQGKFRRRRIQRRFNELVSSVTLIQKAARRSMAMHRFQSICKVNQWLQNAFRRYKAKQRLNWLRTSIMIDLEMRKYHAVRNREIIQVKTIVKGTHDIRLGGTYSKASGTRHQNLHNRFMFGIDYLQDLSKTYEEGWLYPMLNFCRNLHKEKLDVHHIAVGGNFTVLVDDASNVYTFGSNKSGQLARRNKKGSAQPTLAEAVLYEIETTDAAMSNVSRSLYSIQSLGIAKVAEVACGKEHCILLTKTGNAISWGSNVRGQLGFGVNDFRSSPIPRRIQLSSVNKVTCGQFHSACLAGPGVLYTWGAGECLGRPSSSTEHHDCGAPSQVPVLINRRVSSLCCGDSFTIARHGARIYSWGKNTSGQLGRVVTADEPASQPTMLKDIHLMTKDGDDVSIATGGKHVLMYTPYGVFSWGWNRYGQLGTGDTEDVGLPQDITDNIIATRDAKTGIIHELAEAQAKESERHKSNAEEESAPDDSPSFNSLFGSVNQQSKDCEEVPATEAPPVPPPPPLPLLERQIDRQNKGIRLFVTNLVAGRRHTLVTLSTGEIMVWGYVNHFNSLYGEKTQLMRRIKFQGVSDTRDAVPSVVTLPSLMVMNPAVPRSFELETFCSSNLSMSTIKFCVDDSDFGGELSPKKSPQRPAEDVAAKSTSTVRTRRPSGSGNPPAFAQLLRSEFDNTKVNRKKFEGRNAIERFRTGEDKRISRETELLQEFRAVRRGTNSAAHAEERNARLDAKAQEKKKDARKREGQLTDKMLHDLFDPAFLSKERHDRRHEPKVVSMPAWEINDDEQKDVQKSDTTGDQILGEDTVSEADPDRVSTQEMRDLQALVLTMNKDSADREYLVKRNEWN